jgi:hypothetical protein
MSRDCPDCGDPLVPAVTKDGADAFSCIACGWSGNADEAPAPTGSPLDVDTYAEQVQVRVPDPRRGHDTRPVRLSPDGARRLAEALEVTADDAERSANR